MASYSATTLVLILATFFFDCAPGFSQPRALYNGRPTALHSFAETAIIQSVENDDGMGPGTMIPGSSKLPGDYGFDPFGLGKSDSIFALIESGNLVKANYSPRDPTVILRDYRDAELRHGRLAMLAALAWPVQELLSPTVARFATRELGITGLSDILTETGGRSPSVLNGGLEQPGIPVFLAVTAASIAALDLVSLRIKDRDGDNYLPGNFGFDPLRLLSGASEENVRDMQEKEVNNGRLAMIAVTAYVCEELTTGLPVVQTTPWLFTPLFSTQFLDKYFAIASAAQRLSSDDVLSMFPQNI